jgi:exonuclease SbcC
MRPLKLTLEGFSGFRDLAEIDFSDADLIAFVGPTGSGKSSIIDGITFALYGSVPRYSKSNAVEPAIHKLATQARICLEFEVAGTTYTALRVIRRTKGSNGAGGATTREARLETGNQVLAGKASEMDDAVEAVLGLNYSQFIKTVVLPQGDFARFLHDTPGDRQQLLRRLLDLELYGEMGKSARAIASRNAMEIEVLEGELAGDQPTPEGLVELEARQAEVEKAREDSSELLTRHKESTEKLRELQPHLLALVNRLTVLRELDIPEGIETISEQHDTAQAQRMAAAEHHEHLATEFIRHSEALEAARDTAEILVVLQKHARFAEIEGELPGITADLADVTSQLEEARKAHDLTEKRVEEAVARREAAERLAGAGAFLADLAVGAPCPICTQVVTEVPSHDPDSELADANKQLNALRKDSKAHSENVSNLRSRRDVLSEREVERTAELAVLREDLKGQPEAATLKKELATSEKLQGIAAQARSEMQDADKELKRRDRKLTETREAVDEATAALSAQRDSLIREGLEPPKVHATSILRAYEELADWGAAQAAEVVEESAEATANAEKLEGEIRKVEAQVTQLCEPIGITATIDLVGQDLAAASSAAKVGVENYRERLAQADRQRNRISEASESQRLHNEIAQLLSARGFERWLLEEAMHDLAERASGRLHGLSGEQYSLKVEDNEFKVVDHRNADEVRDVRTLSGGETFLASLALALALAESISSMAAAGTPRLESVFLDEGFGTLDAEALDSVASAIEELGSERLVGVVTHIKDLADRVPVRFAVSRDARTSRVERVEI